MSSELNCSLIVMPEALTFNYKGLQKKALHQHEYFWPSTSEKLSQADQVK